MFTTTHVSDPLAAAVGLTVVETLGAGGFDAVARRQGDRLRAGLLDLQSRHDHIGDVRGRGLLQGLELVTDLVSKTPADAYGTLVTTICLELGLHLNIAQLPGVNSILRLAPPLTTTDDELDAGLALLDRALTLADERG